MTIPKVAVDWVPMVLSTREAPDSNLSTGSCYPNEGLSWSSQAKVLTGWRRLARSASRRPRLLAIPVFDRIAGLYKTPKLLTGEYAYANDFEVKLRALTEYAKD